MLWLASFFERSGPQAAEPEKGASQWDRWSEGHQSHWQLARPRARQAKKRPRAAALGLMASLRLGQVVINCPKVYVALNSGCVLRLLFLISLRSRCSLPLPASFSIARRCLQFFVRNLSGWRNSIAFFDSLSFRPL